MSANERVFENRLAATRFRSACEFTVLRLPVIFRYTWFLETEKRDAMVREGREEEVNALVADGRAVYDKLCWGSAA